MKFYLGIPEPSWLPRIGVPAFVSVARMQRAAKELPRATQPWALDSGGFSQIGEHGSWENGLRPREYARVVRRYREEVGFMDWAAPQDWMCEPPMLQKTGLSVAKHQVLTVANFVELRRIAPDLPIIPALQGWELEDYLRCVDLYISADVDLWAEPVVGLGSVCRRSNTDEITRIVSELYGLGLKLHGFGVKTTGIENYGHMLLSADSMAWSFDARMAGRRGIKLCDVEHPRGGKNCANCPAYARQWRDRIVSRISAPPIAA